MKTFLVNEIQSRLFEYEMKVLKLLVLTVAQQEKWGAAKR